MLIQSLLGRPKDFQAKSKASSWCWTTTCCKEAFAFIQWFPGLVVEFPNPIWKICASQNGLDIFPKFWGEHEKCLKPPASSYIPFHLTGPLFIFPLRFHNPGLKGTVAWTTKTPAFHLKPQINQHVFLVFNGMDTLIHMKLSMFTSIHLRHLSIFCVYKFHAPKKLCKEDHPSPRWNKRHFTVREEPTFGPDASGADSKAESINFFPREPSG